MDDNILLKKTYAFSLRIAKLSIYLQNKYHIYDISRQILRSGTSIGANTEEAMGGFSNKNFRNKLTIAYQEARETNYWIRILRDLNYLTEEQSKSLLQDSEEIKKILGKIISTMNKKIEKNNKN